MTTDQATLDEPGQASADLAVDRASAAQTITLAAFLLATAALLGYTFLRLWPDVPAGTLPASFTRVGIVFSPEIRMLLLVMCAGGLGSFVHVATSFADYVGNGRLGRNWALWYVLRLPIGMVLALVIYVVVRGGMLAPGSGSQNVSSFGMAALAFLSGMFSKQGTDKLDEVFRTLFKTGAAAGDAQRKDKLTTASPTITAIAPSPAQAGVGTLTIDGTGFTDTTVLSINGQKLAPTLVSATRLTIELPATLSVAGTLAVKAIDNGQESAPVTLQIT